MQGAARRGGGSSAGEGRGALRGQSADRASAQAQAVRVARGAGGGLPPRGFVTPRSPRLSAVLQGHLQMPKERYCNDENF